VMTLVTLIFIGLRDALTVTLLTITLGSIIGGFLSPTFFWACLEEKCQHL